MTMIRLDAATLAKLQAADGPVLLCNEAGTPVLKCEMRTVADGEPQLTPEEWRARAQNPVRYKLAEVWERIHRGETF
jgi:hypothetical protein